MARELHSARQNVGIDQAAIEFIQELAAWREQAAPALRAMEEVRKARARQQKFLAPYLTIPRLARCQCCYGRRDLRLSPPSA